MNFRVNLAVAFAAAFSFACAEKSAPSYAEYVGGPDSAVAARKVGSYRVDVTPVVGTRDVIFDFIPLGSDGNPTTNPPGMLQVRGQFRATVSDPNANGNPCTTKALDANVVATNFATEALTNLWIRISGLPTGFEACNSDAATGAPSDILGFGANAATYGLWNYGTLSGAPNALGTTAGGSFSRTWWIKYATAMPTTFFFEAYAVIPALPTPVTQGAVVQGTPLTWTNGVAGTAKHIQVCAGVPQSQGLDDLFYGQCPVGATLTEFTPAINATTQVSTSLSTSTAYYWRIANGTIGTLYSYWVPVFFTGPPALQSPANAAPFLQNAAAINLEWTVDVTNLDPWGSSLRVCTSADCVGTVVAGFPVALQNLDTLTGVNTFDFVAGAPVALHDATTGWLTPGTYYWQVANVQANPGAGAPVAGAYGAARSFVVGPIAPYTATVSAATGTGMTWTISPLIAGTTVVIYDADPVTATAFPDANATFDRTNILVNAAGVARVGVPGTYDVTLALATGTYWYEVFANDFFALDGLTNLPTLTFDVNGLYVATALKASGTIIVP